MWGRLATCGRVVLGLPTGMQMPTRPSTTRPQDTILPHNFRSISNIGKLSDIAHECVRRFAMATLYNSLSQVSSNACPFVRQIPDTSLA